MKNLSIERMEEVQGGSCARSLGGWGFALAGAFAVGVGATGGALLFAGAFVYASIDVALSCKEE
jgi:hypothetical protein